MPAATPTPAPKMKPALLPMRRMSSAAGIVATMVPMTKVDTGRVAQALDGASWVPTSPAVAMSATVPDA